MKTLITLLNFVLLIITFAVQTALAELSPCSYKEMQKNAPEYLNLQILSVKTEKASESINVEIEAKVMAVHQSKSQVKPGDVIHLHYVHNTKPLVGPRPIPILEKGKVYPAFLTKSEDQEFYEPAAMGRSFEVINKVDC